MLKLLREELRPALQKCWSTEAANVASAVAASEDDRASTAANTIDFIKGQLVQNGAEAAQKLRERLAGAWRFFCSGRRRVCPLECAAAI